MMKRLDVDALVLVREKNGEVYTDARTRRLLCQRASGACDGWMVRISGGPDFCLSSTASMPAHAFTLLLLDV